MPSRDLSSVTLRGSLQCALDVQIKKHVVIALTHRTRGGSSVCLSRWSADRVGIVGPVPATPAS